MVLFARALALVLGLSCSFHLFAANPMVEFATSRGTFVVELYPEKAPKTVENFMQYVSSGFYSGTVFHRAIRKFMVQAGGFTEALTPKPTGQPIPIESTNGLSNDIGTLAMARGYAPDSATSQFFVNLENNRFLNYHSNEAGLQGYAVFGRVVKGLNVLQQISDIPTRAEGVLDHIPNDLVTIHSARLVDFVNLADNTPQSGTDEPLQKKNSSIKKGKKRG